MLSVSTYTYCLFIIVNFNVFMTSEMTLFCQLNFEIKHGISNYKKKLLCFYSLKIIQHRVNSEKINKSLIYFSKDIRI